MADRLQVLLHLFSPWEGMALTYRQLAAALGPPVTQANVKKWPQRKKIPADIARLIVARAKQLGLIGVTLEWVLWGDGPVPERPPEPVPGSPASDASLVARETAVSAARLKAPQQPRGGFAAKIAEALRADLSHNEFGQWSSVEVQRTVIWALKDLARRLRTLKFDMGSTFELTDEWASELGLPVRPRGSSSRRGDPLL